MLCSPAGLSHLRRALCHQCMAGTSRVPMSPGTLVTVLSDIRNVADGPLQADEDVTALCYPRQLAARRLDTGGAEKAERAGRPPAAPVRVRAATPTRGMSLRCSSGTQRTWVRPDR